MPTSPPHSATVIVLEEGTDGIFATVLHWPDKVANTDPNVIPPRYHGLIETLKRGDPRPTFLTRNFATRSTASSGFTAFINGNYPQVDP